jgi:hypothetical protein
VDINQNSNSSGAPVLNVVLHGAYAFVRRKDSIEALIPSLKHHVFRAGNWLGETELRNRGVVYELQGVKPGAAEFDPDRNLIVKSNDRPQDPSARITLRFPLPKQIYSLRIADVPRGSFQHPDALRRDQPVEHVATLQVFVYDFEDENQLFLKAKNGEGHYWEPAFTGDSINLHIFSSEDHYGRLSNSEEDFNECAELLGSPVRLDTSLAPTGILEPNGLPHGVSEPETEDLSTRTLRMARLGRLVARNADANLAWYGNDALDGNPIGCGSPVDNGN